MSWVRSDGLRSSVRLWLAWCPFWTFSPSCCCVARLCHRHLLGNVRYTHPYLHRRIPCCRTAPHHLHLSLHGRCSLRRPCVSDIRHHHHGIGRRRMHARSPRIFAVAIRPDSGWRKLPHLHRGWFHPYLGHGYECHRIMDIRYIDARIGFILFK